MQRLIIILLLLGLVGVGVILVPQSATAQDGSGSIQYTVKQGDTLYSIARQHNVTVASVLQANPLITNPNLIFSGQVLNIPTGLGPAAPPPATTPSATVDATPVPGGPTPTVVPGQEVRHRVQTGENLFRIALRYGTTVQAIMALNPSIQNPNVVYVGQELRITTGTSTVPIAPSTPAAATPSGPTPLPSATSTVPPLATSVPVATEPVATPAVPQATPNTNIPPVAAVPFDFGIQVEMRGQDSGFVVGRLGELGMHWVKQDVSWALYEATQGNIDFTGLDAIVDALDGAGYRILLTVTSSPNWARATSQENGPPNDYQHYANFVGAVATRYAGRVDAYEIWSEPNLRQNWNGKPISGTEYVNLLKGAFAAIKAADPAAIVVTAGLAPTGLNDGVNAVDDRAFLRQMYWAGVIEVSDAIGAHPFGWANAPDSTCCETDPTIRQWDDHESFFFKETLQDYRGIMMQFNDVSTFIWVTQFGWGTSDGFQLEVDPGLGFVEEITLDEQTLYTLRAFQIAEELTYIGPMFAWNLNFCQVEGIGLGAYQCYWSMLNPAGDPRPVFLALRDLSKD